jgi:hypothetical protein
MVTDILEELTVSTLMMELGCFIEEQMEGCMQISEL